MKCLVVKRLVAVLPILYVTNFLTCLCHGHSKLSRKPKTETGWPATATLFGSIHDTAYYFTDVMIGYPLPQRQSLIVDTGSSVTAFACQDCESCGQHIDPPYNRSVSESIEPVKCAARRPTSINMIWQLFRDGSSRRGNGAAGDLFECDTCDFRNRQCMYRIAYMEGSSLQGHWYRDVAWVGHRSTNATVGILSTDYDYDDSFLMPVDIHFGCHTKETHLFIGQEASGILGLEPWSRFGPQSFVHSILSNAVFPNQTQGEGVGADPVFAICLAEDGGVLSFGGTNARHHTWAAPAVDEGEESQGTEDAEAGVQWTPMLPIGSYSVDLTSLAVGANNVELIRKGHSPAFEALIDSGTTLSYFPFLTYYDLFLSIEEVIKQRTLDLLESSRHRVLSPGGSSAADRNRGVMRRLGESSTYSRDRREIEYFVSEHLHSAPDDEADRKHLAESVGRLFERMRLLEEVNQRIRLAEDANGIQNSGRALESSMQENVDRTTAEQEALNYSPISIEGAVHRGRRFASDSDGVARQTSEPVHEDVNSLPPSAAHRITQPAKLRDHKKEECWHFANGDKDLAFFPNIELQFGKESDANGIAKVVWRPKSYLYRKGGSSYRCLALLPEDLSGEAVLGSSFFIGRDVVFDIGHLRVGFANAACPSVKTADRPSQFHPYERAAYDIGFQWDDEGSGPVLMSPVISAEPNIYSMAENRDS